MKEWSDHAIILRMGLFHESDYWLRVLFKEHGLSTIFAFGGARSLHRFCGCLDLLNSLDCRVKVSGRGNFLNLQEAALVSSPVRLRHDWRRMGIMANCLRFLEIAAEDVNESRLFFNLLHNLRETLDITPVISNLTPIFFRFAVATLSGFALDLHVCGDCRKFLDQSARFMIADGKFLCPACEKEHSGVMQGIFVTQAALNLLRTVQFNKPQQWPHHFQNRSTAIICSMIVEKFIAWHMGIGYEDSGFKKLSFYQDRRLMTG